jgi:hypothetical protein
LAHTATLLPEGRVLIAGGYDPDLSNATGSLGVFAAAEIYDPKTGSFSPTGSMTTARAGHTATLLADGRVLVAGGDSLATAEIYDPKTGSFGPTGSMANARVGHTATLLADGRVLVTAGTHDFWDENYASAELYDPTTGSFGPTGSITTLRDSHTATLLADGRVLVTGGHGVQAPLASAEIFVP